MEQYHAKRGFQGTVLVAEQGRIIFQKGFGYASLEWQIPNTLDTRLALPSVSKPFAATLAVLAAQAGELSLDDKISKYLPDYPKEKGDRITVRHLLLHTAGIQIGVPPQYDRPDLYQEQRCKGLTRNQYLAQISEQELLFEPGTQYQYSNWGYSPLAMVLEKAVGKEYPELLRERFFGPLGMRHNGTEGVDHIFHRSDIEPVQLRGRPGSRKIGSSLSGPRSGLMKAEAAYRLSKKLFILKKPFRVNPFPHSLKSSIPMVALKTV